MKFEGKKRKEMKKIYEIQLGKTTVKRLKEEENIILKKGRGEKKIRAKTGKRMRR